MLWISTAAASVHIPCLTPLLSRTLCLGLNQHMQSSKTDLGDGGEGLKAVQVLTAGPPSDPLQRGGVMHFTTHHHRAILIQHHHPLHCSHQQPAENTGCMSGTWHPWDGRGSLKGGFKERKGGKGVRQEQGERPLTMSLQRDFIIRVHTVLCTCMDSIEISWFGTMCCNSICPLTVVYTLCKGNMLMHHY